MSLEVIQNPSADAQDCVFEPSKQASIHHTFSLVNRCNPLPSTAMLSFSISRTIVHLLWQTILPKNLLSHQVFPSCSPSSVSRCLFKNRWCQGQKTTRNPTVLYISRFFLLLVQPCLRLMRCGSSMVSVRVTREDSGSVLHQGVVCWVLFSCVCWSEAENINRTEPLE